MRILAAAILLFCTSIQAENFNRQSPNTSESATPITQLIRIFPEGKPRCYKLYQECIWDKECCSGKCGGFGQRVCIKKEWQ